ncbi:hypothetical protein conserved [Leishmania donovani]|nr:hypothetical protein, conserved [Leishmania donovani]AYU79575.1 hypothetical protein LdCL_250029600 [Leishmania donovani]TPP40834.1 hypothetical protein CGC21_9160 [Leishmania donovani]TPP48811.1 hypothetical protein CGC20_26150 [Leishmania donovani]CAJ1989565.1 hypothetical protein conserved [Leishmania donovani]CBZ34868.1 hypothetical protein, conserved [Leishmania donovani]
MSTLLEIYRHSFPKRLRFDKASQVLYAQCYSINRRYKNKKYIPQKDIHDVLNSYAPMPGAPWLQLPIVRHVLLIRLINSIRGLKGGKSWLYNRNVEEEHRKIVEWLGKEAKAFPNRHHTVAARASTSARQGSAAAHAALEATVERERFEREVLRNFHVATMYQRMVRLGFMLVAALCCIVYASLHTDNLVYLYLCYWRRYNRREIMEYFRDITLLHTVAEVPPAYASLLPPPCVRYNDAAGDACYAVNMVEMVLPQHNVAVIAIPCPQAGEKSFFAQVGSVAEVCDGIIVEGVTFDKIDKLVPAAFFPLKTNTFPALGLHHRFLDILRNSSAEPPMLYPAGADVGWGAAIMQALLPYELRCVYNPTKLSATKGEARIGWGHVRQVLEEMMEDEAAQASGEKRVLCLPWTLNQIVNIEASLVKYGFKVRNVYRLHWQREDHMGEHFCDYFSIAES